MRQTAHKLAWVNAVFLMELPYFIYIYVYIYVFVFKVTEGLHCEGQLCELTSGTLTLSLEVPEETAVK